MHSNPSPTRADLPLETPALPPNGDGRAAPQSPARISSHALFGGAREIEIEHKGVLYRLRQTALGKLILTK